jgi:hypothetical protein
LIARLFGGDASEVERTRALDQMAECQECEALFADLGVIADATAALPAPVRPRDFTLTEADAARLGLPSRSRVRVFGLGLRRSLGGAVAALGIVGMVAAGTGSFASQTATTLDTSQSGHAAALPEIGGVAVTSAGAGSKSVPVAAPTSAPVALATSAPIAPQATRAAIPPAGPSASDAHEFAVATPGTQSNGTQSTGGAGPAGASVGPLLPAGVGSGPGSGSGSGPDSRLLLMLGFAVLFVAGLAIVILPVRRNGRSRGAGA